CQSTLEVHRRDLPSDEPLDQVLVPRVALRCALEDPLARLAAELIAPASVLGDVGPDPVAIERRAERELAQVAQRRQRLGISEREAARIEVVDDDVPQAAPAVFPARILVAQPRTLGLRDACARVEEQRRPPEP